jgi:5-formyltetrahydrofolate cyclo-ligase
MSDDLVLAKAEARKQASKVRSFAHKEMSEVAPLALLRHVFPVKPRQSFSVVSAFWPYKSELDTRPLLGKLAGDGWTTSLPIVVELNAPLIFRQWYPGEPIVPGMWDIPQPADTSPLVEPDVLLVPMLSFDRQGYRLGYGGGFYDRTLAVLRAKKSILAIGVAYAAQEIASVTHDRHDQPLDFVMTEKELITIQLP